MHSRGWPSGCSNPPALRPFPLNSKKSSFTWTRKCSPPGTQEGARSSTEAPLQPRPRAVFAVTGASSRPWTAREGSLSRWVGAPVPSPRRFAGRCTIATAAAAFPAARPPTAFTATMSSTGRTEVGPRSTTSCCCAPPTIGSCTKAGSRSGGSMTARSGSAPPTEPWWTRRGRAKRRHHALSSTTTVPWVSTSAPGQPPRAGSASPSTTTTRSSCCWPRGTPVTTRQGPVHRFPPYLFNRPFVTECSPVTG